LATIAMAITGPRVGEVIARLFPASWGNLVTLFVYYSFPSQAPAFCLGVVLYFLLVGRPTPAALSESAGRSNRAALYLVAATFVMFVGIPNHIRFSIGFVLLACGLAAKPMRLLVNRATQYVGRISYSVYIWHFWVLDRVTSRILTAVHISHSPQVNGTVQFGVLFGAVLLLSLVIASASYYLIETPGQQLGKKLIKSMGWGPGGAADFVGV